MKRPGSTNLGDESGLIVDPSFDVQPLGEARYQRVGTGDVELARVLPLNGHEHISSI